MKDKENLNCGKLYFLETGITKDKTNFFGSLTEINSYSNNIKEFQFIKEKAIGITSNNELILWESDIKKSNTTTTCNEAEVVKEKKEEDNIFKYSFLLKNPIFIYNKIKMKNISINKTMCLSLDINGNVLVWGENKDGLLGLGYDITSVKSPFIIEELKDIVEISLSENHAVALNYSGVPFSWGLGKYGELGQERSIYNPFPQQMSTYNLYSKVFCSNLITCFLDFEGHFSYFGVIIKNLSGNNSLITIKNLLNDESNFDGRILVFEKNIDELDKEKIINVSLGNGFVGLLSDSGNVYVLEFNDKLTKLYNKYFCYNISVSNNELYGLLKNNINVNCENNLSEKDNKTNYYLSKWSSKFSFDNSMISDGWSSTIWKIKDDFDFNSNYKLLSINNNYKNNILFFINMNTNEENINKSSKNINEMKQIFEYNSEFNDSFNLKYKRDKSKNTTVINDISINGINKSRSLSKYLNKTYNNFFNKGMGLQNLRNKNYSVFGFRNNNYLYNYRRNIKSNTMKNKDSIKSYKLNLGKNDINNKNNDEFNIYDDTLELKEKELIKYRNEINDIISKYKKKKVFKSLNSAEFDKNRERKNKFTKENSPFSHNQGITSKYNNIPYSGRISKNLYNSKNAISKENSNINLKKNSPNNNNIYNNIDSNIEEFFGKESSNIIKNDFSDINESSNSNLNYLSPNIDISNKRYNFNNCNNSKYSDRDKNNINNDTLNFSGGNFINKKIIDNKKIQRDFFDNNGEISPCFSKGHNSIHLINSISYGRTINLDKSNNDFFSDEGRQSKNNIGIKIDKNELFQISDSDKQKDKTNKKKLKNLNIDIEDSNYKTSFGNNNSFKNVKNNNILKKICIFKTNNKNQEKKLLLHKIFKDKNLKYLQSLFILDNKSKIYKKCSSFFLPNKKYRLKFDKNLENKYNINSSPNFNYSDDINLSLRNEKSTPSIKENNDLNLFYNKNIDTLNSNKKIGKKQNQNQNEFLNRILNSNNIIVNPEDSFANEDYISNEARRTGKFHKLSEDLDNNIKYNKNIGQNPINMHKDFNENNSKKNNISKNKNINSDNKKPKNNKKKDELNYPILENNDKLLKRKFVNVKMNKSSLCYFCFLINHYLKKMSYKMCIYEIANYQKSIEKKYAVKMIYRMMKKRIIFYKIKFFRRIKKIYRFLIKYEERLNMIKNFKSNNNNNIKI